MTNPFANKFAAVSGINLLMDDMADGLRSGAIMLGGGNPGFVPQVLERLSELMHQATPETVKSLWGEYSNPLGDLGFRQALAELLGNLYGWPVSAANIALTNGSQAGFFSLFNLLSDGIKPVVLPSSPEYIGYNQLGLHSTTLKSYASKIVLLDDQEYIYTPDFDAIRLENAAAVCISRPCNPSGKVHTAGEIAKLRQLCRQANVPLVIDNAYGEPFPGIVFGDTSLPWDDGIILAFSLSKLGMPASRTGIFLANEELITQLGRINAVTTLAPNACGPRLITPLVQSGELLELCNQYIRPFYQQRANNAAAVFKSALSGLPCRLHRLEGGLFLWLWMPDLPITSYHLYQRCKERGVIVVPGEYFFPGMAGSSKDHECIRISYAGEPQQVERGLELIAKEIRSAYNKK